jgi:3-oxoacyl-[acyl-carrier protein] reductase
LSNQNPLRRFIAPVEIANLVAYLAADAAAGIHGQTVAVDGGTSMA